MSHPEPSKSSESKAGEEEFTDASSPGPRTFLSLEHEVRSDIKCLIKDKVSKAFNTKEKDEDGETKQEDGSLTPASELQSLALEFIACTTQERRCTSHRMRLKLPARLAPGVILDTPGAGLFFYRLWETLVDEATESRSYHSGSKEKCLATACDWQALDQARAIANERIDRAIKLIKLVQDIKCEDAASWSVWGRPGKWADLPLLEHMFRDYQFALPDAISQHEDIPDKRIQRYVCGAMLPTSKHAKRGEVRELIEMRWKWLQLQRFGALLWNDVGRTEYFPHAMRALDALANFDPQESSLPDTPKEAGAKSDNEDSSVATQDALSPDVYDVEKAVETEVRGNQQYAESYYAPFVEWSEPPPTLPPTFLQLLLAEGAAIWLCEAMPVIRRYIQHTPITQSERTWFECARESEGERNQKWRKWREGLEKVHDWCVRGNSGVVGESTVIKSLTLASAAMARAERSSNPGTESIPGSMPRLIEQASCLSCSA
ncbi:hypothetical protein FRC07_007578 [Ceratobasidium sp. 392]|nr:hypothetical protein FRC07_007578 [Ceratobasidium sp. 392]